MTASAELAERLRQMIAVLQVERQALAALDIDALISASASKGALCNDIGANGYDCARDAQCRALAQSARQLNDTNHRMRNILAHNVSQRLDMLTGHGPTYRIAQASRPLAGTDVRVI